MALQVELVAADRLVWEGDAKSVSARTTEGDVGILAGHTPLLAALVGGPVTIVSDSGRSSYDIDGGFLSVHHDRVKIVAENVDEDAAPRAAAH